jgi:hypothetical protein
VDGRPFAEYIPRADYSTRELPSAPERHTAREPAAASGAWTGSAIGGMADLEALSSRGAVGRKPPPSSPSKTPLRGHSRGKVKNTVRYEEAEKPKEVWTGSAVGGMADLEAMMARSSGPSPAAKKQGQKKRRR